MSKDEKGKFGSWEPEDELETVELDVNSGGAAEPRGVPSQGGGGDDSSAPKPSAGGSSEGGQQL